MRPVVFGITGGMGSGKSTVAQHLRSRGVPVIDADRIARDVVVPGSEGLAAVVAAFGPEVLGPDGALDRARLGAAVFGSPDKRRALNAILHPRIAALTAERIAELTERGEPLIGYDAALLVENGLADAFRPLVVVAVAPEIQLARVMARDGLTEPEARARISSQLPLADKLAVADHVIDTSREREATFRRVDEVLKLLRAANLPR